MEHISEIKLLDYVAGRLPGSESQGVRRHLTECSDCANRHRQTLDTWDALGKWQVDSSAHQIAERLEALAAQAGVQGRGGSLKRSLGMASLRGNIPKGFAFEAATRRIAAAILLAVGGGHLLGRFTAPPTRPGSAASTETPRYLAALGFEWSSELTWTVLQENEQNGASEQ